jgi:hypothetical protein
MTDNKRTAIAAFVLETAAGAGIKLGTDGDSLAAVEPRSMPWLTWRAFEDAFFEHQHEIIRLILAEREGEAGK